MPRVAPDPSTGLIRAFGYGHDEPLAVLFERLAPLVETFVAVGRGDGPVVEYVAEQHPQLYVIGCDPDVRSREATASRIGPRGRLELRDAVPSVMLDHLRARPDLLERPTLFWVDGEGPGDEFDHASALRSIAEHWSSGFVLARGLDLDRLLAEIPEAWPSGRKSRCFGPPTDVASEVRFTLLSFGPDPEKAVESSTSFEGLLERIGRPPTARRTSTPERGSLERLDALLSFAAGPKPVVIDGGAGRGATASEVLSIASGARVHCFEPDPDNQVELERRHEHERQVRLHPVALGAEHASSTLHRVANSESSSLLPPSALARSMQGSRAVVETELQVALRRLADEVEDPLELIKLDVQGCALEALQGAGERLSTETRAVLCTVEFTALFEGQALWGDVHRYLIGQGFELFRLYEVWTAPCGRLTAGDALYVNPRLAAPK